MTEVLSRTYGRPGPPGEVEVAYLRGLREGDTLTVEVDFPGKGGAGGPPAELSGEGDAEFVDRGGAGGGRENTPIFEALKAYAEGFIGSDEEPLCFLEPGKHEFEWPCKTSTGTLVRIGPRVGEGVAPAILCAG